LKRFRSLAVAAPAALATSLLLARVHPFGNAGFNRDRREPSRLLEGAAAITPVRAILAQKCADCHSTETRTPLYGRLAPVSWLLERDILEARKAMNLSEWDSYSADQQQTFKAKIVEQTRTRQMPLFQYRLVHWNARITDAEEQELIEWAKSAPASEGASNQRPAMAGDPVRGREIFEKRCTGCHALETDREGPRLQGVFGRVAGSVPGYSYSTALRRAHIVWNADTLDRWLTDPDILIPGNNMEFHVAKANEREDVISFFQHLSGRGADPPNPGHAEPKTE